MKKLLFLTYAWGSTLLFGMLIIWLATIPNFRAGDNVSDEVIKVIFRMTLYSIFFILIYRSVIITLKTTVERLSKWRSKREEAEDSEFVLIIETAITVLVIFATITFAFFEEHIQLFTPGRNDMDKFSTLSNQNFLLQVISESHRDILVSIMAILLTAIVVYSIPVIGELEMAIKHKFDEGRKKKD